MILEIIVLQGIFQQWMEFHVAARGGLETFFSGRLDNQSSKQTKDVDQRVAEGHLLVERGRRCRCRRQVQGECSHFFDHLLLGDKHLRVRSRETQCPSETERRSLLLIQIGDRGLALSKASVRPERGVITGRTRR